ncbi:D-glycero-D-manno-heptose 1,7-bisphosphate phosphatase [Bacillus oleivorans]|uniref:D,D-heptose 1,7-bisphosphate phosphatase n=1 Tax=Bacillus oleivorans TaxID=1448271 RepID=A0A285D2M3_9BACI|nr:HAD family hydrolase [Bacillus oleivorans]SNX74064.1 D-glycero-D-manno-heptose 1,7-bisphosphate phosphatase [Bacillus oleivorans]
MKPAVFLDRDGVINEVLTKRVKFVNHPSQLYLLPGVEQAILAFNQAGLKVFVVTNQGGVGLGFMKEATLHQVHERLIEKLAKADAAIDDIAYCPHKPHEGCQCRKPEPGMLLNLADKHGIDLSKSYMVGDRDVDIIAGKRAGCTSILVAEGEHTDADATFPNLLDAAKWIIKDFDFKKEK